MTINSTDPVKRRNDPPIDQVRALTCRRACHDGSRCQRTVSHPDAVCYSHDFPDPAGADPDDRRPQNRSLANGGRDRVTDQFPSPEVVEQCDELFTVLSNQRRRNVLVYLNEHSGTTVLSDLHREVAAWENDTTVAAVSSAERQRAYVPLYQLHLPKLDAYGAIEYDQSRGTIERLDRADQFDAYLRAPDAPAGQQQDQEFTETGESPLLEEVSLRSIGAASGLGGAVFAMAWLGIVSPMALLALSWTAIIGISLPAWPVGKHPPDCGGDN